ncbi:MAG TPA: aminodeoxychorismate/anthranilate synthase component II [Bacillota bacterium]|nr:aminodeoxychorismate/anthranilate synthase component II [Clostridiales bacterium]HPT84412.1 aminodeoxychorismate/anthranilate synthase component II [Bacillota bacterium]
MVVLIDNYDSFSYNLYQLAGTIMPGIAVFRNDTITVEELDALNPEAIILSPGPGRPEDAGICVEVVRRLGHKYPILGVCLGLQAICAAYGGQVTYAKRLMHGKQSKVLIDVRAPIFKGLPPVIYAGRYHSLAADRGSLPACLSVIAKVTGEGAVDAGEVMAVAHREHKVFGLQFHPESILTPDGRKILENFFAIVQQNDARDSA